VCDATTSRTRARCRPDGDKASRLYRLEDLLYLVFRHTLEIDEEIVELSPVILALGKLAVFAGQNVLEKKAKLVSW
jgi:hypothetical protein